MKYPVFVISLQKDEARREALKTRFKSYDEFCIIDALNGESMSAKEYFSYLNISFKAYKRLLSPAEICCSLSHVRAYEEFLKSDCELCLILEDDIIGDDESIKTAFEMACKIDKNSVLICGAQDGLNGRFSAFAKRIFKDLFLVCPSSYGSISRAASYIVTRDSARALVETHKKAICTSDVWDYLLKTNGLKMYFCDIFSHPTDLSGSNIEAQRNERGYRTSFRAYLRSFKFIIISRIKKVFFGFERIFRR